MCDFYVYFLAVVVGLNRSVFLLAGPSGTAAQKTAESTTKFNGL